MHMCVYACTLPIFIIGRCIISMHVACRWEDDVESNTTKDSVETGKEKSTWLRLNEKLISTWRRIWGYNQLTHPLRIMVTTIQYSTFV